APRYIPPMKARLSSTLPKGEDWRFEVKLDGIRAIAVKDGNLVRLFSRRPRDLTANFPEIVAAVRALPAKKLVVDGEIVALDDKGRSSFQLLQNSQRAGQKPPPILYYIFDLLNFEGSEVMGLPLEKRKEMLGSLLKRVKGLVRFSPSLRGVPARLWTELERLGLEGLIAKKRHSTYVPERMLGARLR